MRSASPARPARKHGNGPSPTPAVTSIDANRKVRRISRTATTPSDSCDDRTQQKNSLNPIHHAITSADLGRFCHHASITCDVTRRSLRTLPNKTKPKAHHALRARSAATAKNAQTGSSGSARPSPREQNKNRTKCRNMQVALERLLDRKSPTAQKRAQALGPRAPRPLLERRRGDKSIIQNGHHVPVFPQSASATTPISPQQPRARSLDARYRPRTSKSAACRRTNCTKAPEAPTRTRRPAPT
jgi:hypothetical protein